METIERIITKLQAVRSSTKSEANKQLLTECVDDLRMMQLTALQQMEKSKHVEFQVRQRVKLNVTALETGGKTLTAEAKAARFLINTIEETDNRAWVVDAFGKDKPQWLPLPFLEPAND